jgi:hypothetical protein
MPLDMALQLPGILDHGASQRQTPSHSLRRVHNIHDMSLQTLNNPESDSIRCDRSKAFSNLNLQSDSQLTQTTMRKISSSPAVPLPNLQLTSTSDGSNLEDDSKAMAEYMYTRATWRMYDRIMSARIKAEEARRKSLAYHSLPPVCKVGKEGDSCTPPTFPKELRSTYTIHEKNDVDTFHDSDSDMNPSLVLGGYLENSCPDTVKVTPQMDPFDHENPVFSLDLDS